MKNLVIVSDRVCRLFLPIYKVEAFFAKNCTDNISGFIINIVFDIIIFTVVICKLRGLSKIRTQSTVRPARFRFFWLVEEHFTVLFCELKYPADFCLDGTLTSVVFEILISFCGMYKECLNFYE